MKITRDNSVAPLIIIDDFLSPEGAAEILTECIELKPVYQQAGLIDKANPGKIDKNFRDNTVVLIDKVFASNKTGSRILKNLFNGNFKKTYKDAWNDSCFEIINYANRFETVLSRYGDGAFYNYHRDGNGNLGQRAISAVYYVNTGNFTGGTLYIKRADKEMEIEPKHNRLVVFKSDTLHQVNKTVVPEDKFEDGRFSLNIWIGFKQ